MKKFVLLILIIWASIFNHGKSLASEVYSPSPEEHKGHKEIKSGSPLPAYFITMQNLLTIYFEAAIGKINLTVTNKNNEIVYTKIMYIGEPMSLSIELDTSTEEYTVYINKL